MDLIFICKNPNCSWCNKERKETWDGVSTYGLSILTKCPECGEKASIKQTTTKHSDKLSTISTPTIDSMTPAERKALLKKRSTADFHKNIEERKKEMDKNVIPR